MKKGLKQKIVTLVETQQVIDDEIKKLIYQQYPDDNRGYKRIIREELNVVI